MKTKKVIEVPLDLGDLKPLIEKAAKKSGVSVNEFICDALQSRIRQSRDYTPDTFVRHGGKHLFGKHTGYEVTRDGKYYPSPSWREQFDLLFAERTAITNLANAVIEPLRERLVQVEQGLVKAKTGLIDDLGLDPTKDWVYYGGEAGYMEEQKPKMSAAEVAPNTEETTE